MPTWQLPERLELMDALPKSAGGKIGTGLEDGWLWTKTRYDLLAADDLRERRDQEHSEAEPGIEVRHEIHAQAQGGEESSTHVRHDELLEQLDRRARSVPLRFPRLRTARARPSCR